MTTDELRAKFEAFHGLSWDGIRTLLINDGTKLSLRNVYKHDFEVWQAAHASRDAEVEALKRDAERYRAIRQAAIGEDDSFIERVVLRTPDKGCTESQFDEAIDDAMTK